MKKERFVVYQKIVTPNLEDDGRIGIELDFESFYDAKKEYERIRTDINGKDRCPYCHIQTWIERQVWNEEYEKWNRPWDNPFKLEDGSYVKETCTVTINSSISYY